MYLNVTGNIDIEVSYPFDYGFYNFDDYEKEFQLFNQQIKSVIEVLKELIGENEFDNGKHYSGLMMCVLLEKISDILPIGMS